MKPKTLILMVVAVTCGLGASYMTSRLLAQRGSGETDEPVNVLVAAKDLPQGLMIKKLEGTFTVKPFIKGTEPKDAILKPEELKGKVLKRSLRSGDSVRESDVSDKDRGLAGMMAEGYRAVGVRVNNESSASGWANLPLSRVDIISTIRRGSDKDSFSQVLLQNVLVLGVDGHISTKDEEQGRAMPGSVVTLALKLDDMLKVTMARELGTLSLALRKSGDSSKDEVTPVTSENILSKNYGKQSQDEEWTTVSGQPPVAQTVTPELPKVPVKPAEVVALVKEEPKPEEPKYQTHSLRILEGVQEKVHTYRLNEKGEVLPREAARGGDASAAPPRPITTPAITPDATTEPRPDAVETPAPAEKTD